MVLENVSSSNLRQPEHYSGVGHNSARPSLFGSFFQQLEIFRAHFHVDLNGSFHSLLYRSFAVAIQRYYWYLSYSCRLFCLPLKPPNCKKSPDATRSGRSRESHGTGGRMKGCGEKFWGRLPW